MACLWPWLIVKPLCTVLGCHKELVTECGRCYIPLCQGCAHCATLWQGCYVVQLYYICLPSPPQVYLPWLSTGHLLLDLHHATFSQDLPLLASRIHKKSTKVGVFKMSIQLEVHIYDVSTLHLLCMFRSACSWLAKGHLILDLHHARFRRDL